MNKSMKIGNKEIRNIMLKFIASSVRGRVHVEVCTLPRSERIGYIISFVGDIVGSAVGPFVVGVSVV